VARRTGCVRLSGCCRQGSKIGPDDHLSLEAVRRLIGALGIRLNYDQRNQLDQKIRGFKAYGNVSFPDFLRLMRWMLDTDFAGMLQVLSLRS